MEYAKDEIFNIKYNAKLDKLDMKSNTRLNRIWRGIKHHKLMTTAMLAFVIFSITKHSFQIDITIRNC